jgi:hypothetical protein
MAEFKISFGLDKLLEVLAQGVGALARPWMIRRIASAEADRLKLLAGAKIEVAEKLQLPDGTSTEAVAQSPELHVLTRGLRSDLGTTSENFENRVEQRLIQREMRRQRNLEAIALGAANSIPDEVSQEPVAEDWTARFFSNAQDISNPELQQLWSRILAREIETPRSTSLRTLETLKNLSSQEAALFQESLDYLCEEHSDLFFIAVPNDLLSKNVHVLTDCGLLAASEGIVSIRPGTAISCTHAGIRLKFSLDRKGGSLPAHIGIERLSEAGKSVANVCWRSTDPNVRLLQAILDQYGKTFDIEVEHDTRTLSLEDFLRGALLNSHRVPTE